MINSIKAEFGKLFHNPFDEKSTLLRKTAFIAFHALTLGIPYAIYYVVDYRFPSVEETVSNLKEIALNGLERRRDSTPEVGKVQPYTFVEWEALNFADKKLEEHPEFKEKGFIDNIFAGDKNINMYADHYSKGLPANPKISALAGLYKWYQKEVYSQFSQAKDPWNNPKFLKIYNEYINISFAISLLTLEDLDSLNSRMPENERSIFRTLVRQDAYAFFAIGFGIRSYNHAKGEAIWKSPTHQSYPDDDKRRYIELYYKNNTIQNRWNKLYNAFCNRIRMYVSEANIAEDPIKDSRIFISTKLDLKPGDI